MVRMLEDEAEEVHVETLIDLINPIWEEYAFGRITEDEYAEQIKPILKENGIYDKWKKIWNDYIDYQTTYSFIYTADEVRQNCVNELIDCVGKEEYNRYYSFLKG